MARLAEMEIEEVSYVDKAANKRKFLFVKRNKGGENLQMLKAFKQNKAVIDSLEAIEKSLESIQKAIDEQIEKKDLTETDKKDLLSKKAEFEAIHKGVIEDIESLFFDKNEEMEEEENKEEEEKKKAAEIEAKKKQEEEEVKKAEEIRKADEAKKAEEIKKQEELKKAEDQKKADEEAKKDEFTAEEKSLFDQILQAGREVVKDIKEYKDMLSK